MRTNLSNCEKVDSYLTQINGRAANFTIRDCSALIEFAGEAEEQLATILPKAAWKGALVTCCPAGPSANAYKHRARSTVCVLERGASGWFLIACDQGWVYPRSRRYCDVSLTELQGRAAMLYANKRLQIDFGASGLDVDVATMEGREMEAKACKLVGVAAPTWPEISRLAANDNRAPEAEVSKEASTPDNTGLRGLDEKLPARG